MHTCVIEIVNNKNAQRQHFSVKSIDSSSQKMSGVSRISVCKFTSHLADNHIAQVINETTKAKRCTSLASTLKVLPFALRAHGPHKSNRAPLFRAFNFGLKCQNFLVIYSIYSMQSIMCFHLFHIFHVFPSLSSSIDIYCVKIPSISNGFSALRFSPVTRPQAWPLLSLPASLVYSCQRLVNSWGEWHHQPQIPPPTNKQNIQI